MAKLVLKFEASVLKEVAVGGQPVTIGRLPDNDLQVDNLAVSSHHARIYREGTQLFVEDLNSLNGTFLNNQRISKAALKDGDKVLVGKHHIEVHDTGFAEAGVPTPSEAPKKAAPKIEETVMMDSKRRKELLQQALAGATAGAQPAATPAPAAAAAAPAAAPPAAPAPPRMRVPTLVVTSGKTDQREYLLSGKLTVIGKSEMATVKVRGFFARLFAPEVAAQINKRDDGYYIGKGAQAPKVNGNPITSATKLNDGDLIEVSGLKLNFVYRD